MANIPDNHDDNRLSGNDKDQIIRHRNTVRQLETACNASRFGLADFVYSFVIVITCGVCSIQSEYSNIFRGFGTLVLVGCTTALLVPRFLRSALLSNSIPDVISENSKFNIGLLAKLMPFAGSQWKEQVRRHLIQLLEDINEQDHSPNTADVTRLEGLLFSHDDDTAIAVLHAMENWGTFKMLPKIERMAVTNSYDFGKWSGEVSQAAMDCRNRLIERMHDIRRIEDVVELMDVRQSSPHVWLSARTALLKTLPSISENQSHLIKSTGKNRLYAYLKTDDAELIRVILNLISRLRLLDAYGVVHNLAVGHYGASISNRGLLDEAAACEANLKAISEAMAGRSNLLRAGEKPMDTGEALLRPLANVNVTNPSELLRADNSDSIEQISNKN